MMTRILFLAWFTVAAMSCATTGNRPGEDRRIKDPGAVLNRTWQWVATVTPVEKVDVTNPESYTIFLDEDCKLHALFDCNRGGGDYKITDGHLSFGPLMSTRMACPEGTQDALFMRDLQRVNSFFVQDGQLFLELPFDSGTMRFRVKP